jgi:hypothetical protein
LAQTSKAEQAEQAEKVEQAERAAEKVVYLVILSEAKNLSSH